MMPILDDTTLVEKFVKGEGELLSNPNLRVESVFETTQLLTKSGEFVAFVKPEDDIPSVSVNVKAKYWELTHKVLLEYSFLPIGQPEREGILRYEKHEIPSGYTVNYTSAKLLWREWWTHNRLHNASSIQLDLLILTRSRWYPIRAIAYNPEELFLTTLVEEVRLQYEDKVIWLKRSPVPQPPVPRSPKQPESIPVAPNYASSQTEPIDSVQRQYAEKIRAIAMRVFQECVRSNYAKEVKQGLWFVKLLHYDIGYQTQTKTFLIAANNRGILCKFQGERLVYIGNIQLDDVTYWNKVNEQLKAKYQRTNN